MYRYGRILAVPGELFKLLAAVQKTCGIYGVRPFACRIYYNTAASRLSCQNPAEEALQLFDLLKRHLEEILGPYAGGYVPGVPACEREGGGRATNP